MATYTRSAAYSGSVNYSVEDQRPDAILSTCTAIVLGTRIQRYNYHIGQNIVYDVVPNIISDISNYNVSCIQYCVCLVAPYPLRIAPFTEFNVVQDFNITGGGDVWYARPQLFFKCTLCPTGQMGFPHRHKEYSLVYFSTFELISLTPDSCMQRKPQEGCSHAV